MNIVSLLNQIDSGEIVLPAIQRNFVWSNTKIEKLMDSILRGYPIGIILMWETYKDVQYRRFERTIKNDTDPIFLDNQSENRLKLVLDGQQRLQSLYIALYGQKNKKYLYLDVLSGRHFDDFEEEKYFFYFLTPDEADEWNTETLERVGCGYYEDEDKSKRFHHRVSSLFDMDVSEKQEFRRKWTKQLELSKEDEARLETNLARLDEVLTKDQNILKASVIDENKSPTSKSRQTESDVLEIFVRINRLGTQLSRSDLIFSMLKLHWKDSATALPDFVKKINEGNSFSLDIDFVIRCLFAVSNLGTKFDIDLLRKKSNLVAMQKNFRLCCSAIEATLDAVQKYCWISSSKAMGGTQNLVPFVYYFSYLPKHGMPNDQQENFRKAFFLFCFAGPFSRYADSRLSRFIKEELQSLREENDFHFPFSSAVWWVHYWERFDSFNGDLIQKNPRLALHLIQQDTGGRTQLKLNAREMDHIFPRSTLREKEFDDAKINHYANFWILGKGKNINKTNKHPKKYFEDVSDREMKKALIDREMLDYRRYNSFLDVRSRKMIEKLRYKIGFEDEDFAILQE